MTRTRTLLHYRVVVDRASGDWLTEPEHLGDVDRDTHLARPDTDAEHYDTHDLGDGCMPETLTTIALTIVWKN